jgi:hypothetical protein
MATKNLLDIVTTEMKNKEAGNSSERETHTYQRKRQERKM